ncbi:MAG: sensor histidine kinase [Cyanobacteria bacterium RM1_2_2]|nr:sensor histidine kinase [Cyanobacteria bacterium RM1_2_2]
MMDDLKEALSAQSDQESEIQRLRAELQRTQLAYHMAKEAEQFKAGFLARTSHELRSPLNSVMSLQQLILSDLCEDADEEREFVAQAYAAAQKLLNLLDKLISVSKATYGTEKLHLQPVLLEDVFMEVQSLTMMPAQNRSQRLEIEYPDPDVQVIADPRWLRQVLVSLVDTPIALMQEGTIRVTSQVEPAENMAHIQIEDERPASFWSEPIDLLQSLQTRGQISDAAGKQAAQTLPDLLEQSPSPGISLLVNQTLIDLMGGRLEVLQVSTSAEAKTCIQCSMRLAGEM